jgi:hypothetical protein
VRFELWIENRLDPCDLAGAVEDARFIHLEEFDTHAQPDVVRLYECRTVTRRRSEIHLMLSDAGNSRRTVW